MKNLATVLAVVGGLFITYVGFNYLLDGQAAASGFGLPHPPTGNAGGYFAVKGVRDIGQGLIIFTLLLAGQRRTLGWAMLAASFVPFGDMTIVLSQSGPVAAALGIHCATAVVVALTGALLLRTNPRSRAVPAVA
ncbi:DUF4267 domain-containing protein [Nonomuraea sp. NPDC050536]|uniref:DUF4267 domain-containing protein n=1 Tax=Nonomuraea sp. NPDC050536 TaxID=3364366 RepID=UPI0037C9F415